MTTTQTINGAPPIDNDHVEPGAEQFGDKTIAMNAPKRTRKARVSLPPASEQHPAVSAVHGAIESLVAQRNAARKLADSLDLEVRNAMSTLTSMAGISTTVPVTPSKWASIAMPELFVPGPMRSARKPVPRKAAPRAKPHGPRLARRSPDLISAGVERVVALLKDVGDGMRAEAIRGALGLTAKEMPKLLKAAVAAKLVTRKGAKRATTYFAKVQS